MKSLLALVLSAVSLPLFASGWFPFTPTSRVAPAAYDQGHPLVASNGIDYLAAWETTTKTGTALYTLRVNADGTVENSLPRALDPSGSFFIGAETHPHGLSLTAGRDGYFVSWISDAGLNVAITDSFGVVERRTTVSQDNPRSSTTIAAWNGAAYLVVSGFAQNAAATATLVDNDGQIIRSGVLSDVPKEHGFRRVVADGRGFLVLTTETTDIGAKLYGVRVSGSGVPGERFLVRSMASQIAGLALLNNGRNDVVVWGDAFGLWMMPLASDSDTAGMARQLFSGSVTEVGSTAWFDDRLWIGYTQMDSFQTNAHVIAVSTESTAIVDLDGSQGSRLATNGRNILAVRSEFSSSRPLTERDVFGNVLTANGVTPAFLLSKSATAQQNGEIANGATNTVAVWDEITGPSTRQIFASVIDSTGRAVAEAQVSSSAVNSNPAIAYNGETFLIAWTRVDDDGAYTVARRLSPVGTVIDTTDIVLGRGAPGRSPRVASDGVNWLVVWSQEVSATGCGGGGGSYRLYAARVSRDGSDLDAAGVELDPSDNGRQIDADVAWNGTKYVIAWNDFCFGGHNPVYKWIVAGTISPDLSRVDVSAVVAPNATASPSSPRVAVNGDRALIAWQQYDASSPVVRFLTLDISTRQRARRRSAGTAGPSRSLAGTLLGIVRDASGELLILTVGNLPTIAPPVILATAIGEGDVPQPPRFLFVPGADERLMGRPIVHDGNLWMPEADFDPSAGADRLYVREFR